MTTPPPRRAPQKSRSPKPLAIKRLFWDIESSPNVVLSWRLGYKINLTHENLLKERAVICIGYRWEGDPQTHVLYWDKAQDDRAMLAAFMEIANEADEMVGHNLDSFDLPWVKTRCLHHGLPVLPEYKTIDTLQWARRKFYFNSNRLDYIGQFLGFGGKIKTEFGLWKKVVLDKDPAALTQMGTYCKRDVELLEKVYHKLAVAMKPKTHVGVANGLDKWTCPRTGSTNVCVSKTRVSAGGTRQYQMRNNGDGSYFTINEAAHTAYVEAKGARSK